jgi:hypothetical protein
MISSAKRIRAAKISAFSAAVYKEDMLHTTEVSEQVARAFKSKILTRVPKTNKTLVPSLIPIVTKSVIIIPLYFKSLGFPKGKTISMFVLIK